MRPLLPLVLILALPLALPSASARECLQALESVCEIGRDYNVDRLFGDFVDIGIVVLGLFLAVLIITSIIALLRAPRVRPRILSKARDPVREIAPGETLQLIADVENRRRRTSVDVALDVIGLPEGWEAVRFGASAFASGFTAPQSLPADGVLHLSSRRRGNQKGAVAVALTAPKDLPPEESIEVALRLTPVVGGVPRMPRSRKHKFTLLTGTARPVVQIANVVHTPARIVPGRPVLSRVVVGNEGNADASNVAVNFLLNDQVIDTKKVEKLTVKQTAAVEFSWTPVHGENRIRINLA